MKLIKFINEHKNWRELLSNPPYSLKIKDDEGYTLFMYDIINSDFYNPIVKEARGVIISLRPEPHVVCRAFDKFGNYGEGYADDIDWASARVQEKVDGSIVKLWWDGEWKLSSNSCINAHKATLDRTGISIGSLFDEAWEKCGANLSVFNPDYTYIFELVSPYNRVVIKYDETKLYFIGKRNNKTGEEIIPNKEWDCFEFPKSYPLSSLEECVEAAAALNEEEGDVVAEGFVVVDKNFHRVKIKSPIYVAKHHAVTKNPSLEDLVCIFKRGEKEEFLTYFPAYEEYLNRIEHIFKYLEETLYFAEKYWKEVNQDKKAFAIKYARIPGSSFLFDAIKFNDWSISRIKQLPHNEIARRIKGLVDLVGTKI